MGNRVLYVTIHMRLRHKIKIARQQGIHDTINRVLESKITKMDFLYLLCLYRIPASKYYLVSS